MLILILHFFLSTFILFISIQLVPGVVLENKWQIIPGIFILGLLNFILRPLIHLLGAKAQGLSLAFYSFVLNLLFLNAIVGMIDDFDSQGISAAVFGAVCLAFIQGALTVILDNSEITTG